MINSILINGEINSMKHLEEKISRHCPEVDVKGCASSFMESFDLIQTVQPKIVFVELGNCQQSCFELLNKVAIYDFETILISNEKEFAFQAIQFQVSGYILKPIHEHALLTAVKNAFQRIQSKKEQNENRQMISQMLRQRSSTELIGVPTIEGYEFIAGEDIVRCEGLQKYTRVVTKDRTDIISSYNLGEFKKLLCPYGFFSPHKSHLINLKKVIKYYKDGTIIMKDNSKIPVARRRKTDFLKQMPHI